MKLQSTFRMWLARKQVQELKYEIYGPGMHHGHGAEGDDYDNINVQASFFLDLVRLIHFDCFR